MGRSHTTTECFISQNRNGELKPTDIEVYLKSVFHAQQVLWLDHGYLAGDDTDSHIDTLARMWVRNSLATNYYVC